MENPSASVRARNNGPGDMTSAMTQQSEKLAPASASVGTTAKAKWFAVSIFIALALAG